ncbi:hypothetical protein B9Z55_005986 [Caenorhabditis nigoni]|uniref:DUF19 domain-containing protein n=1 Tax=Caenorhabditis nigoni TaxID=1611254 RepID=A0A2G5V3Z7_9PELO|nr:hypothetical protein B9Z55_005986 [Caenorhabditis nigoni]
MMYFSSSSLIFALFYFFNVLILYSTSYQTRFKRDFMLITDGNMTDAKCFGECQEEYRTKFEYTLNQSLSEFYDFPFHPVVLETSSFQLYCKLSEQKTKCFAEKCNDYAAENSFSPSNFVCLFKRSLFEKALKCLVKTEPITFLKCDHECHEEIVRTDRLKQTTPNNQNQIFVSSDLATYETELDKLCRFQSCYMNCMAPVVKEMCGEEESKSAIEIVEAYVQWHADDISDWHSITGNDETLPEACQILVKTHSKTDDPILQIIGNVA